MTYFNETIRARFEARGEVALYDGLQGTYGDLATRRIMEVDYPSDALTNQISRLKSNCVVCQHALLHRATRLFKGAMHLVGDANVDGMALCVRAHLETVGALGYLHKRLMSYFRKTIPLSDFHRDVFNQTVGCKHASLAKAPDPKNIMTQLDCADEVIDKELLVKHGFSPRKLLRDDYEYLSEFCHPNFHSNSVAFELNRAKDRFLFRYSGPVRETEFSLIGYLNVSNPFFIWLFDEFGAGIPKIA
jgi:hypothetical protein